MTRPWIDPATDTLDETLPMKKLIDRILRVYMLYLQKQIIKLPDHEI